jgi:hypothetical protein
MLIVAAKITDIFRTARKIGEFVNGQFVNLFRMLVND